MSLPNPLLIRTSTKYAIVNMLYSIILLLGFNFVIAVIGGLIGRQGISTPNLIYSFTTLVILGTVGVAIAVIPTVLGASKLAIWFHNRNNGSQTSSAKGAVIGAQVISLVTIPLSIIFILLSPHGMPFFSIQAVMVFIVLNVPIMVCAAIAGARTGLQLEKFIKAETQPTPSKP